MIKKKITLLTSVAFLATTLLGVIPAKAVTINPSNTISSAMQNSKSTGKKLTVMVYCDADNNLEDYLLGDIQQMKDGYVDNPNLNLIVLVDRTSGYSTNRSVLGQNFTDTRMYKIGSGKAIRISGGNEFPEITTTSNYEANMGDGDTLKKFIDSCKSNYPADEYALIVSNHGGGARENELVKKVKNPKAVCWDDTNNGDCLYTAEVTDSLTSAESVDLLAYDACLMGTAEVAYQYRPGNGSFQAGVMVASAPVVWGDGYDYKKIFSRIKSGGGNNGQADSTLGGKELYYDPSTVTADQLGAVMVEAQRDSVNAAGDTTQVLSCFDLAQISNVKNSVDKLARALWSENDKAAVEKLRGTGRNTSLIHYFNETDQSEWLDYPYFDLYDLCKQISTSSAFSTNVKSLATEVMTSVDDMNLYSYGGSQFKGFTEGKSGLSIFLPDGSKTYRDSYSGTSYTGWQAQRWYNSVDTGAIDTDLLYGKLSWCIDGETPKTNDVGNWFELLDSWFDRSNDTSGGVNWYQW
ncbi:clostripain [Clostridium sp. SHJSY1]|uniref:clostripain n=1 Tax=Clostridium sp. SHJSY1 TaxID=2942483 RepID=UPI0028765AC7|nr:clostripain [Clostridium sp. SHJSY1]MDS0525675.1 clostripain [Clostridium sp. SHJSY1]